MGVNSRSGLNRPDARGTGRSDGCRDDDGDDDDDEEGDEGEEQDDDDELDT